jgi:hypothetical protein
MAENVWKLNDSPIFWVADAAAAPPRVLTSYHFLWAGEDIAQKAPEVVHEIYRGDHRHMQE